MTKVATRHLLVWLALASNLPARAGDCKSGESARLAAQAVTLAREAVAVQMPADMPEYLARYFPTGQDHYSREVALPGAPFQDPILVKRIAPSLYRRLTAHYSCSWTKLAHSLVCLPEAYTTEGDERVKTALAVYVMDVANEVAIDVKHCHFLVAPLLEMIANEKDAFRRQDLWHALNQLDVASFRETDFPQLMGSMTASPENEASWSEIFDVLATMLQVARQPDLPVTSVDRIVQFVFDLTSGPSAPLLARVYFARDANIYASYRPAETDRRLFQWLEDSLAGGGDKVSDTIIRHYNGSSHHYDRLVPYLIQSLGSARVETRCTTITFIGRMTRVAPPENMWGGVPYNALRAEDVPRVDWPEAVRADWEREHGKALRFWQEWWAQNRSRYETSSVSALAATNGVSQ